MTSISSSRRLHWFIIIRIVIIQDITNMCSNFWSTLESRHLLPSSSHSSFAFPLIIRLSLRLTFSSQYTRAFGTSGFTDEESAGTARLAPSSWPSDSGSSSLYLDRLILRSLPPTLIELIYCNMAATGKHRGARCHPEDTFRAFRSSFPPSNHSNLGHSDLSLSRYFKSCVSVQFPLLPSKPNSRFHPLLPLLQQRPHTHTFRCISHSDFQ